MTLSFLQQNKVFIESSIVKDVLIFEWSPVMPLEVDTSTDVLYTKFRESSIVQGVLSNVLCTPYFHLVSHTTDDLIFEWSPVMPLDVDTGTDVL